MEHRGHIGQEEVSVSGSLSGAINVRLQISDIFHNYYATQRPLVVSILKQEQIRIGAVESALGLSPGSSMLLAYDLRQVSQAGQILALDSAHPRRCLQGPYPQTAHQCAMTCPECGAQAAHRGEVLCCLTKAAGEGAIPTPRASPHLPL